MDDRAPVDVQQAQCETLGILVRRDALGHRDESRELLLKVGNGPALAIACNALRRAFEAPMFGRDGLPGRDVVGLGLRPLVEFDQRRFDLLGAAHAGGHARRAADDFLVPLGHFGNRTALRVDLRGQTPQGRQRHQLVATGLIDDVDDDRVRLLAHRDDLAACVRARQLRKNVGVFVERT